MQTQDEKVRATMKLKRNILLAEKLVNERDWIFKRVVNTRSDKDHSFRE